MCSSNPVRTATASLPAFSIAVNSPPNTPPVISGTPPTSATAESAYAFQPTASDPDGDTLTFSVANEPAWAAFSATTGRLSGTPTASQVGTYANVDGSPLTNLSGYRVYWGTAVGDYPNSVTLNNPGLASYVVENLGPGNYYFVVSALSSAGTESSFSNVGSKTIQ